MLVITGVDFSNDKVKIWSFHWAKKKFGLVDYPFFTIFILIKHRIKNQKAYWSQGGAKKPLI